MKWPARSRPSQNWCRVRYLFQGRHDRTETHFLGEAMRGLHLLLVEGLDERTRGSDQPVDGRAVERNLHDALADAAHYSVIRIAFLTAGELAQRGFNRRPIGFLCGVRCSALLMRATSIDAVCAGAGLYGADAVVITTSSARAAGATDNKPRVASATTPAHKLILIVI